MDKIEFNYQGNGEAEFLKPKGILKGPIQVSYDEFGVHLITMRVTEAGIVGPADSFESNLISILKNEKSVDTISTPSLSLGYGNKVIEPANFTSNTCIRLQAKVTDDDGLKGDFSALEIISSFFSFSMEANEIIVTMTFEVISSIFSIEGAKHKYWRIGLINFDLNVPPTNPVPELATKLELLGIKNPEYLKRVIPFEYEMATAFIQLVEDYDLRIEKLQTRHEHGLITAIMVGDLPIANRPNLSPTTKIDLPQRLLAALAFATGTEVGYCYMEILDDLGNTTSRFHDYILRNSYYSGHFVLNNVKLNNFSKLLTKFQQSTQIAGFPNLTVLATYIVRIGATHLPVEDRLAYAFRALDGLCSHYGFAQQNLMKELDTETQNKVRKILSETGNKFQEIIKEVETNRDLAQSRILNRIKGKVSNVSNIDKDFGLLVVELLKRFDLPDADIIDQHYQKHPSTIGASTWAQVLSIYRGKVIHDSYLAFGYNDAGLTEAIVLICHLHDLLLRLIFLIIQYEGNYCPVTLQNGPPMPIKWVTPITSALLLGYKD